MAYREKNDTYIDKNYTGPRENRLSESELQDLDKELSAFFYEKESESGKKLKLLDEKKWLIEKGALNYDGAVIVNKFKSAVYNSQGHLISPADCAPIKYEQCMADLYQWRYWKGKNK